MFFFLCGRKQLVVPPGWRIGVKGVKSRVAVSFKRHEEIVQAHFLTLVILAAARPLDVSMMPTLLLLCSILRLFHGFNAASAPSHRSSVSSDLQASQSMLLLQLPPSPWSPYSALVLCGPYVLFPWWLMVVNGECVPSSTVVPTLLEPFLKSNIFFIVKLPL